MPDLYEAVFTHRYYTGQESRPIATARETWFREANSVKGARRRIRKAFNGNERHVLGSMEFENTHIAEGLPWKRKT